MSPEAADPRIQDRIATGTRVLDDARAIHDELCAVLDDLDQFVRAWSYARGEEGDSDGGRR